MARSKKERDKEISELKKRIEALEKDSEEYDEEEKAGLSSDKNSKTAGGKKYARILVVLIIIIVLLDVIALAAFYKPDFSGLIKPDSSNGNISGKCSDGTLANSCSRTKPMFCYNGELVSKAASCGCPAGYKVSFQDCVKS